MKPLVSKLRGNNKITDDLFYMEKRAETSVILIVFDGVLCEVSAYTVTVFVPSLNMVQVPVNRYCRQ
jgi:hypothetical protein